MPEHNPKNPQNVAPTKEIRAHSTFDLNHFIFGTHRFGIYNVNFARECVGDDGLPVRTSEVTDSYTLKAPLMQDVSKTREYYFVPKQCLLPINWDKIERLPALGDDVNASLVNSTIDFSKYLVPFKNLFNNFTFEPADPDNPTYSEAISFIVSYLKRLLFAELFFSQGSLLAATGCHLSGLIYSIESYETFDKFDLFFDSFISKLASCGNLFFKPHASENEYYVLNLSVSGFDKRASISVHRMLELMRDSFDWDFGILGTASSSKADLIDFAVDVTGTIFNFYTDVPCKFSIDRVAAYQIVCAHYYSNDSIDFIHDADLWRQNMFALFEQAISIQAQSYNDYKFTYNGVATHYDTLSANVVDAVLNCSFRFLNGSALFIPAAGFFINLLGWRRSLRYGDYFVGSKARPLAPGDFSVAVNSSAVSVIDITKKISLQRLANNVNRIGNSIKEWYRKIMGSELAYDYHNPMWLASTRSTVYAAKNENTNNADVASLGQVNTSANFVGRDGDYEFNFHPDRNGVIIGVTYYDIRRAYSEGIDRMLQHVDRFDGFIPDLQYIGDQDIRQNEIVVSAGEAPFAYTLRNMEYKQFHDECYGGFAIGLLPGFSFLYQPSYVLSEDGDAEVAYFKDVISPEFIRSRCDEFDQFYVSLTGFSNASYFHFIVKTNNGLNASRPMVFAPQIL